MEFRGYGREVAMVERGCNGRDAIVVIQRWLTRASASALPPLGQLGDRPCAVAAESGATRRLPPAVRRFNVRSSNQNPHNLTPSISSGEAAMPVQPTFPGVYIEEAQSGVRTIAGVSTSRDGLRRSAPRRAPVNTPMTCFSFGDFNRGFGVCGADGPLSYSVDDFFANGGSGWGSSGSSSRNDAADLGVATVTAGTLVLAPPVRAPGATSSASRSPIPPTPRRPKWWLAT